MSDPVHSELVPPKTWQQFEEFCADVFAAEWADPALVRHGRGGQAQSGVDIYGRCGNQWPVGLQCKRKSQWPETHLTPSEVDSEITEALKFKPSLKSYYILTTAPDDKALQEHARLVTEKQLSKGLFEVNVLGWGEICRRASRHPSVIDKHFGSGGGPKSPLLAVWFATGGRLEIDGKELSLSCRELWHELRAHPSGRVVLRQRESEDIAAEIASYGTRDLSYVDREKRLALRDNLARKERDEDRISKGLKLLLGERAITTLIFEVYQDSGDAARAVTGFVNHELDSQRAVVKDGTIRLKVRAPGHPEIARSRYISQDQAASIMKLKQSRTARYGPTRHTEIVDEMPEDVRADEAIPAVISELSSQLAEEADLEKLRKAGILNIALWSVELG